MLAILYLVLSWFAGYTVLKTALPRLFGLEKEKSLFGKPIKLAGWMVTVPASFLAGTLMTTWFTYMAAYAFRWTSRPMLYGNMISFLMLFTLALHELISKKKAYRHSLAGVKKTNVRQCVTWLGARKLEAAFLLVAVLVSSFLMFYTFNVRDGKINVGLSVFSDFGPHLAMIRSFSHGSNFPTQYPHFPAGNVRYHFLFQFLAGNLEFLGLPLDWAFNLPSILSLVSFAMLLYSLAVLLMGERWVGILTMVLFFFRSSFAFFTYLSDIAPAGLNAAILKILANDKFIGKTAHEVWGLWNQNVYVNQRHFAFSLGILILVLVLLLPLFEKMIDALKKSKNRRTWLKEFLLKKDAWMPESIWRPVAIGVLLGSACFWNGAVVIAAWLLLLFIAMLSKHRFEHLIVVASSMALSLLEAAFFIGPASAAVHPRVAIGFLAANPGIQGILAYYIELLGPLPFVLIAALPFLPKGGKWLAVAFGVPLAFATVVQLTPDVPVNHKYVMISVILLDMMAANFLYRVFNSGLILRKAIAAILLMLLTVTGVVDAMTLYNINQRSLTFKMDDPTMVWVEKNTDKNDVFLTDTYWLHPILLAGRKIFHGWPYYAWSAGYDTGSREATVKEIYGAADIETVKRLVREHGIDYVVIDDSNRNSKEYRLNERLIKDNFGLAYENAENGMAIYRTR